MKALLIINMQNKNIDEKNSKEDLINRINDEIKNYDSDNVYYIKTIMKDSFYNKYLAPLKNFEDSNASEIIDDLDIVSNNIYSKHKMNTFKDKELVNDLREKNIEEVVLVGFDSTIIFFSAVLAFKKDFKVTIDLNLIDSYDETILDKVRKLDINIIEVGNK